MTSRRFSALALLMMLAAAPASRAQDASAGQGRSAPPTPVPSVPAVPPPSLQPVSIVRLTVLRDGVPTPDPLAFEIGDMIALELSHGELAALQKAALEHAKKLGLLLNGHFMAGLPPIVLNTDEISFGPIRTEENKSFWSDTWGERLWSPRNLTVAVGLEDATVFVTASNLLTAQPLHGAKAVCLGAGGLFLLGLTIFLARTTSMLRDGGKPPGGGLATYSLGRTQMAFWFFNVVLAVLLVWAVTGAVPPVTPSVLALLGIGAGTALGASVIDQSSGLTAPKASSTFLTDILTTDGGSTELHRFQMLVWTLVLFFIFWGAVWSRLALPDFDATLLALMGISSGTYLGFKFPENQSLAQQKPTPP